MGDVPDRGPDASAVQPPGLTEVLTGLNEARGELTRFMATYEFAIKEIETKVSILQGEFRLLHRYNPIEHIVSRLKSPESVVAKARKLGCGPGLDELRTGIRDIAGVRVVCSFTSDVYRVQEMLCRQADVRLIELKDYIADPKPSGYRSLHAIVEVPVFLSEETVPVPVELQFRTIAQDFWASLEHKIFYKYDRSVPAELRDALRAAAATAAELDQEMERLSVEVQELAEPGARSATIADQTVSDFLGFVSSAGRRGPAGAGA
ncbi:GTP pyrophosphokinase [Nocardioides pantholopis]|uniref:GTP pyrophosphokinase n=1 Tax=Nocardioides pantholopis TaxID=2483798 RepID=UPI001F49B519|nr:GTP pyrophosphokinase family protein [Nocardioides pantholopis]